MTDFATRDIAPPPLITYGCGKATGFTLIELSTVLVVIGLMVIAILSGQSIIHASELKSVISEFNKYRTAINLYDLKYDALPGDHRDAYDYFDGSGGSSVCGANALSSTGGCNGNGDGIIVTGASITESFLTWKHLKLAGLIHGNVPTSGRYIRAIYKYDNASFAIYSTGGNAILFLRELSGAPRGIISPVDAAIIDKKIDDGIAGDGRLRGIDIYGGCTNNATSPKTYKLNSAKKDCLLIAYF